MPLVFSGSMLLKQCDAMKMLANSDQQLGLGIADGKFSIIAVGSVLVFALALLVCFQFGQGIDVDDSSGQTATGSVGDKQFEMGNEESRYSEITFYTELKQVAPEFPPDSKPGQISGHDSQKNMPEKKPEISIIAEPGLDAPLASAGSTASIGRSPEASDKTGFYTIQVGSFKNRTAADDWVSAMRAKGLAAEVARASLKEGVWHRVHIGNFETREEAVGYCRKSLDPKGVDGFVVSY